MLIDFFDIATVVTAFASVASGIWAISSTWAQRRFTLADYRDGAVDAMVHAMNCFSTALSIWHLGLMIYWSAQDGAMLLGGVVNSAFQWWHISAAMQFVCIHTISKLTMARLCAADGCVHGRLW